MVAEIFKTHLKDIYGLSYYYLNHQQDSQDVAMEVFEVFIKKTQQEEINNPRAYLMEITRRTCLSFLRKKMKQTKKTIDLDISSFLVDNRDNEHMYTDGQLENLLNCMSELKDNQRLAIHDFYIKGYSYKEIEAIRGITMKDIKSYIQNGKRNLKIRLLQMNSNEDAS